MSAFAGWFGGSKHRAQHRSAGQGRLPCCQLPAIPALPTSKLQAAHIVRAPASHAHEAVQELAVRSCHVCYAAHESAVEVLWALAREHLRTARKVHQQMGLSAAGWDCRWVGSLAQPGALACSWESMPAAAAHEAVMPARGPTSSGVAFSPGSVQNEMACSRGDRPRGHSRHA